MPKNSSTPNFSFLDLFIGQASLTTCSGRVSLQVERVGEKSGKPFLEVGETDSPEPVTGITGCDGLLVTGWWQSRVLVTARSSWRVTVNPSQGVTAVTLKLNSLGLLPFFVFSPNFVIFAHGGLYCCVPET